MSRAPDPRWPAILRLDREIDVTHVASQADWDRDVDLWGYDEPGVLIDSRGLRFELDFEAGGGTPWLGPHGKQKPVWRGRQATPAEVIELVRPQVRALGQDVEAELLAMLRSLPDGAVPKAVIDFLAERLDR